jgi:hypothetical protein
MGLLDILNPLLGPILDRVIPDPAERRAYELKVAELAQAEEARASAERIAQTEVNKVEAGSSVLFVAGWRPAVGWACVAGLVYNIVLAPAFHLGLADSDLLQVILLGMLGISVGARSIEKIKGVAQNSLAGPQPTPISNPLPKPKKKVLGVEWPF